jgi:hypothetical protein
LTPCPELRQGRARPPHRRWAPHRAAPARRGVVNRETNPTTLTSGARVMTEMAWKNRGQSRSPSRFHRSPRQWRRFSRPRRLPSTGAPFKLHRLLAEGGRRPGRASLTRPVAEEPATSPGALPPPSWLPTLFRLPDGSRPGGLDHHRARGHFTRGWWRPSAACRLLQSNAIREHNRWTTEPGAPWPWSPKVTATIAGGWRLRRSREAPRWRARANADSPSTEEAGQPSFQGSGARGVTAGERLAS